VEGGPRRSAMESHVFPSRSRSCHAWPQFDGKRLRPVLNSSQPQSTKDDRASYPAIDRTCHVVHRAPISGGCSSGFGATFFCHQHGWHWRHQSLGVCKAATGVCPAPGAPHPWHQRCIPTKARMALVKVQSPVPGLPSLAASIAWPPRECVAQQRD
jgi:hypothetical protein